MRSPRFDPAIDAREVIVRADEALAVVRRQVASLLDDEILQSLKNLMRAVRTTSTAAGPAGPQHQGGVRAGRPRCRRGRSEIYVHSRLLEGITCAAAGGARKRWSDRHDGSRTGISA
jgi:hypothetical protein